MDASFVFSQFMGGLTAAMFLFLIASGLSLVFGVVRVLNFAHGVFYMIGSYLAWQVVNWLQPMPERFWPAVLAASFGVALLGAIGPAAETAAGKIAARPCMSPKALMSDHWGRPGGRCVPRTSVTVILFEERPPALNVEAEEYPRAHQEPVYKAGRRWCRVGGPDGMVKQTRPLCLVTRSSVSMLRPANWW